VEGKRIVRRFLSCFKGGLLVFWMFFLGDFYDLEM
jgi:hypothetical protein